MDKTKSTGEAGLSEDKSPCRRAIIRMVQNALVIWLDKNIDVNSVNVQSTMTELRRVTDSLHTFNDRDQSIDFLTDTDNGKAYMIISGTLCQNIVPLIHDVTQLYTIFIFCKNKNRFEQWARDWPKIKGVFTDVSSICKAIKKTAYQSDQNEIPISIVRTNEDVAVKSLDQLNCSFMYTQIIKEILLTITFEEKHIKEFFDYSRDLLTDNNGTLQKVNTLEREYHNQTPISWYTSECLFYSGLNRALRTMEVDIIIKMGFFISDLHHQIQQLYAKQFDRHHTGNPFSVFRGQGMSKIDFGQLMNTKGGLLSFNNFLSTSKNREVSQLFAESNLSDPDLVGVLFVMTIDTSKSTTPFASVTDVSSFQEEDEVLFSMHTVFRICGIKLLNENERLFQVDLILTSNNDKDLRALTDHIREETFPDSPGWYRLGLMLCKIGQPEKAQEVYKVMLNQTNDEGGGAAVYDAMGSTKYAQGEYEAAIAYYEKSLDIKQKTLPPNHPNLAIYHNNIGAVYISTGKYSKALSFHEKALMIQQQSLPPNHPDLATSLNNIGAVYISTGEYSKALSIYEKALMIQQQSLPRDHPDLASSHNNIGSVYVNMGEYSKALSSHEKALAIQQKSLPPNHPDLAIYHNNIGNGYANMAAFSKALSSYEKALSIQQKSLPPNHPSLATSHNNIGNVYANMGECSKALSSYEKAFAIQQNSLPPNHPDLAIHHNNIGAVYNIMGEYSKALSSYEKAFAIQQQSLPPNHPDLAKFHSNIGGVYKSMGEYQKARPFYERAVDIGQHSLPSNHPHLQIYRQNLDRLKKDCSCIFSGETK